MKYRKLTYLASLFVIAFLLTIVAKYSIQSAKAGNLSIAEMEKTFGSCYNCIVGQDVQTDCDDSGCPGCQMNSSCSSPAKAKYGTGKYYMTCKSGSGNNGTCWENPTLVHCTSTYWCQATGEAHSPRICEDGSCVIPETGGSTCRECEKGDSYYDQVTNETTYECRS